MVREMTNSTKCDATLSFTNDLQNNSPVDLINPVHTTQALLGGCLKRKSPYSSGKQGAAAPDPKTPGCHQEISTHKQPRKVGYIHSTCYPNCSLLKPKGVGSTTLHLLCLGPREKSNGRRDWDRRPGTHRIWVTRTVRGIYSERANKQTQKQCGGRGWGDG